MEQFVRRVMEGMRREVTLGQLFLSGLFTLTVILNAIDPSMDPVEIMLWCLLDLLYVLEVRHRNNDLFGVFVQVYFMCYLCWLVGRRAAAVRNQRTLWMWI